jgi:hypothetical protein
MRRFVTLAIPSLASDEFCTRVSLDCQSFVGCVEQLDDRFGCDAMSEEKRFWFPAKRYGWGWGVPSCWQGWAVLLIWSAVFFTAIRLFPRPHAMARVSFAIAMFGLLLIICYVKGEPPGWRWGNRK